jgi:uncharacterized protein YegL
MSDFDFSGLEFADNPDPRCPVVLILDASSSMSQKFEGEVESPMDALNSGLDVLISELNKDPLAKRRVEVSVVSYGTEVSEATPFATVDNLILPTLLPSGMTSTGKAINVALDALEARKKEYKENGIQIYRPWALLITDGLPTDDISEAAKRVKEYEEKKKVSFFAVGVEGADMDSLAKISVRQPMKLSGMKFSELFQWLSASQSAVSSSQVGDKVSLPSPAGWAEV